MRIEIKTEAYNRDRYSKPWIAVVDFSGISAKFKFGSWVGSSGQAGILVIEAEPDQIICIGKKENSEYIEKWRRNKTPSDNKSYYFVDEGGKLQPLANKAEAYKYAMRHKTQKDDVYQRLQEMATEAHNLLEKRMNPGAIEKLKGILCEIENLKESYKMEMNVEE